VTRVCAVHEISSKSPRGFSHPGFRVPSVPATQLTIQFFLFWVMNFMQVMFMK
jgi:hypothetical protein